MSLLPRFFRSAAKAPESELRHSPPLPSFEWLSRQMGAFTVDDLRELSAPEFEARVRALLDLVDSDMEGYVDSKRQRDLSIRFRWGHNHDFGTFSLDGQMGNRHLWLLSMFMDDLNALPRNLTGKRVLDIGVWTGGTSLLLHAMGAEVVAVEEVKKYADAVAFLGHAFGLDRLKVINASLYECVTPEFQDGFDIVLFAGVLYHVTDPTLALRIVFNALKDGGTCLLETYSLDRVEPFALYEGPRVLGAGSQEELNRGGWNWYRPSPAALQRMMEDVGFQRVQVGDLLADDRVCAVGTRVEHTDMLRAGLSQRSIR